MGPIPDGGPRQGEPCICSFDHLIIDICATFMFLIGCDLAGQVDLSSVYCRSRELGW